LRHPLWAQVVIATLRLDPIGNLLPLSPPPPCCLQVVQAAMAPHLPPKLPLPPPQIRPHLQLAPLSVTPLCWLLADGCGDAAPPAGTKGFCPPASHWMWRSGSVQWLAWTTWHGVLAAALCSPLSCTATTTSCRRCCNVSASAVFGWGEAVASQPGVSSCT
jgi:hypothetical protein